MEIIATLARDMETKDATLGTFSVENVKQCETLEHLWKDNQHNISRIPPGTYRLRWLFSKAHNVFLWHISDVPNRDAIEIHSGNSIADTKGCVIVGRERYTPAGQPTFVLTSRLALVALEHRLSPWKDSGCLIQVVDLITVTSSQPK